MRLDAAGKNASETEIPTRLPTGAAATCFTTAPSSLRADGVAASKHGKRGKRVKLRCRHTELLAIGLRKRTANADKALARVRKITR